MKIKLFKAYGAFYFDISYPLWVIVLSLGFMDGPKRVGPYFSRESAKEAAVILLESQGFSRYRVIDDK